MEQNPAEMTGGRGSKLIGLGLLVWLLSGLAYVLWLSSKPTTYNETPLASAEFPDGQRFDILRLELTKEMRCKYEYKPLWRKSMAGAAYAKNSNTTSTNSFMIVTETDGYNQPSAGALQTNAPSLMVLGRWRDARGKSITLDDLQVYEAFTETIHRHKVRCDGNVFQSCEEERHSKTPPLLTLEVEDGGGGWLTMNGLLFHNPSDGRGFAMSQCFPRRSPKLRFRVSRLGLAPVFLELPNPGYVASPPIWTAQALPIVHKDKWLSFKIDSMSGPRPRWEFDYPPNTNPIAKNTQQAIAFSDLMLSDASGNRAEFHRFHLVPGERIVRISGKASRSPLYPWSRKETITLAEGVWPKVGETMHLNLTKEATDFGVTAITADCSGGPQRWHLQLPLRASFQLNSISTPGSPFLPTAGNTHLLVYLDEDGLPADEAGFMRSERYGASSSAFRYGWFANEPTKPGTRVILAIPQDNSPLSFEFTLPVTP